MANGTIYKIVAYFLFLLMFQRLTRRLQVGTLKDELEASAVRVRALEQELQDCQLQHAAKLAALTEEFDVAMLEERQAYENRIARIVAQHESSAEVSTANSLQQQDELAKEVQSLRQDKELAVAQLAATQQRAIEHANAVVALQRQLSGEPFRHHGDVQRFGRVEDELAAQLSLEQQTVKQLRASLEAAQVSADTASIQQQEQLSLRSRSPSPPASRRPTAPGSAFSHVSRHAASGQDAALAYVHPPYVTNAPPEAAGQGASEALMLGRQLQVESAVDKNNNSGLVKRSLTPVKQLIRSFEHISGQEPIPGQALPSSGPTAAASRTSASPSRDARLMGTMNEDEAHRQVSFQSAEPRAGTDSALPGTSRAFRFSVGGTSTPLPSAASGFLAPSHRSTTRHTERRLSSRELHDVRQPTLEQASSPFEPPVHPDVLSVSSLDVEILLAAAKDYCNR